ncbi:hypothetical protein E2562_000348 [Oryza meyeriana var. granulata]|uniref:Uncharacterized protein n=1 Tax=Oryza meyeriana var. granulata TaxID=110450 RepID=A0A6G1CDA2_9ORYZ|nr:hypothetical protein E2562_000348 [Oryza meyeriana var. granulata]
MSYWRSPGASSAAWRPGRRGGPSPVVPFLIVVALVWVNYNETLTDWYDKAASLPETVAENAITLVLAGGLLLLSAVVLSRRSEVVIVPVALVLSMLLLQNIMVFLILLLVVAYFTGIYYYPAAADSRYGVTARGEWGGGGCSGLGFYMLLLLCLVLCAMFADEGVKWWIPGTLLAASLLCLNLFSGGQVLGYGHL